MIDVYTSSPPNSTLCACTTVKKLSRVLGRFYDSTIAPSGINITQLAVLRCTARRSGEPLVRIAEEMEMDRTSLYRAINPMIRDGWLVSSSNTGARNRTVRLTKKGNRILADANRHWRAAQKRIIGSFGKDRYTALLAELYRLADCAAESN